MSPVIVIILFQTMMRQTTLIVRIQIASKNFNIIWGLL